MLNMATYTWRFLSPLLNNGSFVAEYGVLTPALWLGNGMLSDVWLGSSHQRLQNYRTTITVTVHPWLATDSKD